jgi:hypothetical protein
MFIFEVAVQEWIALTRRTLLCGPYDQTLMLGSVEISILMNVIAF